MQDYNEEDSIWEKRILSLMSEAELEAKIITELRFFHYVRRFGRRGTRFYLMSKLRFNTPEGESVEVLHRMYYACGADAQSVRYALCIYEPLAIDFKGKSIVVDSIAGTAEELDLGSDIRILTPRERQILSLIDTGMKSRTIAARLNISIHTVSRHRQEILAKLQVKTSIEACRIARSLKLIWIPATQHLRITSCGILLLIG